MKRSIAHDEYTYKNRKVVLDTCEISAGHYETMLLVESDGAEIDSRQTYTEVDASAAHEQLLAMYQQDAKPLTGKYAKLRDDLKTALAEGRAAEEAEGADCGTCNFDSPSLYLPRWNKELVEQAAKEAGSGCYTWKLFGQKRYVFHPNTHSQGWPRSKNAEVCTKALTRMGYDAFEYCQMD